MSLPRQVLDLSGAAGHLSKERGFLVFQPLEGEVRKVPLDAILSLLIAARQVTLSATLLCALAEAGALVLVCGSNMQPQAIMTPLVSHHELSKRAAAQAAMKAPLKKRLWQTVVQAKLRAQAAALELAAPDHVARLKHLAKSVKSGDPENLEAQGAQIYWPALMGTAFRRRPEMSDANMHLNYGYAIVRACVARAVVSAGLLPSLGLFHRGSRNPFVLIDDLMEPYRPLVDRLVYARGADPGPLDRNAKAALVAVTSAQVAQERGMVTLIQGCHDLATSLALVLLEEREKLDLPALSALSFSNAL